MELREMAEGFPPAGGAHMHREEGFQGGNRQLEGDPHGRPFGNQQWGGTTRGRGRFGWHMEGRGGFMQNGMPGPGHFMPPGRGSGRWGGRGNFMDVGPNMPVAPFQLPLPPQQDDGMDDRGMPAAPGLMQGDGMQGRMGRGQFRGRGRSWGRGMPGGFRRAGGPPLDPAVLERRRKSTAAAVQRQLENVLVSEELAGSKGFTHYQRAVSVPDVEEERVSSSSKALWAADRVKQCYMMTALPSVENHAGTCDYDALDAFELCLSEYQGIPVDIVSLQASKHGTFLAPRTWEQ